MFAERRLPMTDTTPDLVVSSHFGAVSLLLSYSGSKEQRHMVSLHIWSSGVAT